MLLRGSEARWGNYTASDWSASSNLDSYCLENPIREEEKGSMAALVLPTLAFVLNLGMDIFIKYHNFENSYIVNWQK